MSIDSITPGTIIGSSKKDSLFGTSDDDVINGLAGNDKISGSAGSDLIDAGRGSDEITGGADSDSFLFSDFFGKDNITDFETGIDTLIFDVADIDSFPDLQPFVSEKTWRHVY